MRDDEDTVPVTAPPISKESDDSVVVIVEVTQVPRGGIPMVELHVFRGVELAEIHALNRHDVEMLGEMALYIDAHERDHSRQRWLANLRKGRPMHLGLTRTIRMRPEKVKESV